MIWRLSAHAVTRYRERINPRASEADAIRELLALCERARYQRPGKEGRERWRVSGSGRKPGDRVRLVVERDGDQATVRTVLPAHDKARSIDAPPPVRQIGERSYVTAPAETVTPAGLARAMGVSASTARRRFHAIGLRGESGGIGARQAPPTAAIDALPLGYRYAGSIAAGAARTGRRWTDDEIVLLRSEMATGEIARRIGRTARAVSIARGRAVGERVGRMGR